jgi:hypothetical protein
MGENGNGTGELVRFGDAPGNAMPAEWVEGFLRLLFERDRVTFGRYLAEYVTGERFTKARVKA